jgi:hypothetical protein
LRLNLEKCSFLSRRLGFIISKDKITESNERGEAIIKAARPSNVSELRGYLGTLNYLRRFIPEFASVLSPFGTLLKGKAKWCWMADHEREFLNVQDIFLKPLINVHFNEDAPLILQTDASNLGIAGILLQGEQLIFAVSRSVKPEEQRYLAIERELLAVCYSCGTTCKIFKRKIHHNHNRS